MDISVLDIRILPGHKSTRAFVDVGIEKMIVRDFRIYQTNGKPSIRNPFTSYKDRTGEINFREIITLPPNVQSEVNAMILSAYFRRLREDSHGQEHR
jgi:hypothetical protein